MGPPQQSFGNVIVSCGFPSGGNLYCSTLRTHSNVDFQILAKGGILYKGMSGGPTVDLYSKKVIGVNSAVTEDGIIIAPVVGSAEIFKLR